MFERVLYEVLNETLQQLVQRPQAMDAFLASLPLDEARGEPAAVREVVTAFAAQPRPIIHAYARDDTQMPVWSIVLAGEQEDLRALGDESAEDDDSGTPIKTSLWNSNYQLLIYSQAPDTTLYLYALAKALVIERRHELIRRGNLDNLSTLGGGELSPDQLYLPEFLFVRVLSMTAVSEQRGLQLLGVPKGQAQVLPARTLVGVHVQDPRVQDGTRHLVKTHTGE